MKSTLEAGLLSDSQRWFYGMRFDNFFMKKKGKEFEGFFASIMSSAYPEDFVMVRPYGAMGDSKCDGFLRSGGVIFQCYAPEIHNLSKLKKKISDDFNGAMQGWKGIIKKWVLMHNGEGGLPAEAVMLLERLNQDFKDGVVTQWAMPDLKKVAMGLDLHLLEMIFGPSLTDKDIDSIGFSDIQSIITCIDRMPAPFDGPLDPPDVNKLNHNSLSDDVKGLLSLGRRKEKLVESYFSSTISAELGEQIAESVRQKYKRLKEIGLSADMIFGELQNFMGGMNGVPSRQATLLSVMSYFFERCDMFDNPPVLKGGGCDIADKTPSW